MWQSAIVWAPPVDAENVLPRWDQTITSTHAVHHSASQQTPSEQGPQWDRPRWPSSHGNQRGLPHGPDSCRLCQSRRGGKSHQSSSFTHLLRWQPHSLGNPAQVPGKMETGPERRLQKQTQRQSVPCDYCALSPGCTLKSPGGALNIDARPQPGTISVDHQSTGTCCGRGGSRPVNCLHGPVTPQEFHFPTDKPAAQIESVQMSLCLQVPPHALPMCSYRRLSHGAMRGFPLLPGASSGG